MQVTNSFKPASASVHDRRAAMPVVAAFIAECRRAYGDTLVDQQLATAQQARREHAEILANKGRARLIAGTRPMPTAAPSSPRSRAARWACSRRMARPP